MVLVPSFSPPPRFTRVLCSPGHISRILSPLFLVAYSPSISVYSAAPLQQRLVFHCLSVGNLPTLRLQQPINVLYWFPVQRPICRLAPPPTPVQLVVLGLGVGGRAKETALFKSRDGLDSLDASKGDAYSLLGGGFPYPDHRL